MTKPRQAPRNTAQETRENPLLFLAGAMSAGGASKAIEEQESAGQQSFVNSDTLPTEMDDASRKALLSAGVKFLGPVQGDPVFQYVSLPRGWKKVSTGHSMWSDLVDDKDRKRASIFYKAAFYDRSAHLRVSGRYSFSYDYEQADKNKIAVTNLLDGTVVIHTTEPVALPEDRGESFYAIEDQSRTAAANWLKQNFPKWEDPAAYWD